jgi:uncharacterized protein YndB with AHSA1/START domain
MIDIVREIEATQREVGERPGPAGAPIRSVRLGRDFDSPIEDVWDAITNPGRIGRWFLPISGDFRLGGRYQFEGNAGGEIVTCERPNFLKVTWIYGEPAPDTISEVEVRLSTIGDGRTRFDFLHSATVPDEQWAEYGPGAVGAGWDGGLLGLALHLRTGATVADPEAWQVSEEGRAFYTRSSEAWGAANRASGADPEVAAKGVANTTAFYTTVPEGMPEAEPVA